MQKILIKLHNLVVRLLSCFILASVARKKYRELFYVKTNKEPLASFAEPKIKNIFDWGENNIVEVQEGINPENFEIHLGGNNNVVKIGKTTRFKKGKLFIVIHGSNCSVEIGDSFYSCGLCKILIGNQAYAKVQNCKVKIKKNTTIENGSFQIQNSNTEILVGENCMMAHNIILYNTDSHPIYDKDTRKIINKPKKISIGNNCWLADGVKVLKNVSLANNTIVGCNSLVTKSFEEENIIIAGIPAKKVKENVVWKSYDEQYIKNEAENVQN